MKSIVRAAIILFHQHVFPIINRIDRNNSIAMASAGVGISPSREVPNVKRKEIYRYTAPWTIYGMNWSVRHDKRFRLAIGSFMEDYCNKVRMKFLQSHNTHQLKCSPFLPAKIGRFC